MKTAQDYYTDDITLLPTSAIWKSSCRASIAMAPGLFAFFYIRKLLKLPFRPNYCAPWPETLPIVPIEALSSEARDAFALRFPELAANGFELAFCLETPFIGTKWGASALFLSNDGKCYATLVWLKLRMRGFERAETTFACHSSLTSGEVISTAPVRQAIWIPELIPPGVHLMRLPENTPPEQVLQSHRQRMQSLASAPRVLDQNSLRVQMHQTAQQLFEHLVGKGYYRKLKPLEMSYLQSVAR